MTRDSIIARPMIIGVTILPEALGFLAIPSNAVDKPFACESAPKADAIAIPKPAAIAIATLTDSEIPAAAAGAAPSLAAAMEANASTPKTDRAKIFFTVTPPFLIYFLLMLAVFDSTRDVCH